MSEVPLTTVLALISVFVFAVISDSLHVFTNHVLAVDYSLAVD